MTCWLRHTSTSAAYFYGPTSCSLAMWGPFQRTTKHLCPCTCQALQHQWLPAPKQKAVPAGQQGGALTYASPVVLQAVAVMGAMRTAEQVKMVEQVKMCCWMMLDAVRCV